MRDVCPFKRTHVVDLLDGEVGVGRDLLAGRVCVDNDEDGVWRVSLEELVDFEV